MPDNNNQEIVNHGTGHHNRKLKFFKNLRRGSYILSSVGTAINIGASKYSAETSTAGSVLANVSNDLYSIAKNAETAAQTPSNNNIISPCNIAFTYLIARSILAVIIFICGIVSGTRQKESAKDFDVTVAICIFLGIILHVLTASVLTRGFKKNTSPSSDEENQNPAIAHEQEENNGDNDILEDDTFDNWLTKRKLYRTKLTQEQMIIENLFLKQTQLVNLSHETRAVKQQIRKISKDIAAQKRKITLIRIGYATEKSEFEDMIQQISFHRTIRNINAELSQSAQLQRLLSSVTNNTTTQVLEETATIRYGETCEINITNLMTNKYLTTNPLVIPARIMQHENDNTELNNWVAIYVDPTNRKVIYFDPYYESELPESVVNLLNCKYNVDNFELITIAPNNLHYGHRSITWLTEFVRIMLEQTDVATITHTLTNLNIAAARRAQEEMLVEQNPNDEQRLPEHVR